MDTDSGLRASIYAALVEGNAPGRPIDDFDVQAIAEEVHQATGTWSLASIEHADFWAIVRKHDRTQQAGEPYRVEVTWHLTYNPRTSGIDTCLIQPGYSTEDDAPKMIAAKRGWAAEDVAIDGIARL